MKKKITSETQMSQCAPCMTHIVTALIWLWGILGQLLFYSIINKYALKIRKTVTKIISVIYDYKVTNYANKTVFKKWINITTLKHNKEKFIQKLSGHKK